MKENKYKELIINLLERAEEESLKKLYYLVLGFTGQEMENEEEGNLDQNQTPPHLIGPQWAVVPNVKRRGICRSTAGVPGWGDMRGMSDPWIPVAERMPEEDGNYLVTMVTPGYLDGRPYTNWLYWDSDGRDWLTDEAGDSVPEQEREVVAWMPLPKPYNPRN